MKIRFLADANFNQKIVAGLLLREPQIEFQLPQKLIPEKIGDPQVLELSAARGLGIVTHDVRTMPKHFSGFPGRPGMRGYDRGPEEDANRSRN